MATGLYTVYKGLHFPPLASFVSAKGDVSYNTATDKLELYNGAVDSFVNEAKAATLTNKTMSGGSNTFSNIAYASLTLTNSILNADINSSAAIIYSKLSLSNSIVNADINTSAAVSYSKLALTNSIINADINASAAVAYSKLALSNSIVNTDINATAAIALTKLAALTNHSRALVSDSSGIITESAVTAVELGYVSGVTSGIQSQINAVGVGTIPAGSLMTYAGSTEPSGWVFSYGQSLVRADFAALFAAIGTTYGAADGTHFNVPDMRGRLAAGRDNMGGSAASRLTSTTMSANGNTLGATGGTQTHTLVTGEMPSHTHTVTDPGHNHTQNSHLHQTANNSLTGQDNSSFITPNNNGPVAYGSGTNTTSTIATNIANTTGVTNQSTGGGAAHLNVQPSLILNYIIKT